MTRSDIPMKLALAALASSACALVAEPRGGAFSLDAVLRPRQQFDPAAELRRLQSRYETAEHIGKRQNEPAAQEGPIPIAGGEAGATYYVPTVIGNQTFQMVFDTGSADLWVFTNETSPIQGPDRNYYYPSSSAHLLPGYNWTITYSGGSSASGIVYTDVVKAGPIVAEKQAVQAATNVPSDYSADGILGLSFGIINQVKPVRQSTFFETVAPKLKQKVFAANLRPEGNGTWDFGYIDKTKYTGDITYTPVAGNGKHWTIIAGEYAAGDTAFGGATIGNMTLDSGSQLMYMPDEVVSNYYSQIPGYRQTIGGSNVFPCNGTIPDFRFKVEDQVFAVPGSAISYGVYDPTRNMCVGAITSKRTLRFAVVGSMFMKNFYVVHSMEDDTPKVGLAKQV